MIEAIFTLLEVKVEGLIGDAFELGKTTFGVTPK
jgi:hypothetical protein